LKQNIKHVGGLDLTKRRRFGLYLAMGITLYIVAVIAFIVAY
jgi:hypothetical protein